ncbi:serine/threonine-protein kinase [Ureibacillus sinduriensis]|uniref:Serine/threonine protein kinase n=1 Tax=Ureibacillus sinduriensis BLB-1 = JCM 15800 TaxID=1384057 RepID=A0A0A3I1G9_9BACL|nr:protein kinase [Ureibacillus sinduriensis]KGR77310.1 serine/threonine protein kinase [Ureibacillus sinduriensis BLB-1 = JCM 15800]
MIFEYFSEKKYDRLVKGFVNNETPYNFIEEIGIGAYGVAYLLEDAASDKKYVLKRLKTKHRHKKKIRQKFDREIKILKETGLHHVPAIISHGKIQDIPFYIMDYIEGKTFEQAIFAEGKRFPLERSLQITKELLSIIKEFHKKGIVHRDLRIPNILLKGNTLYIIDFGLASYINEEIKYDKIINPKRTENHISDLYFIGHFLLFLLYSNYTPTIKKEKSWQEELQLPSAVVDYIERLLLIRPAFSSAEEAFNQIPEI